MFNTFLEVHRLPVAAGGLLDVDPFVFGSTVVLFIVLAFILNAMVFNPLLKVLEERERRTSGSISDAKHLLEDYDRRLGEYETSLNKSRQSAYQQLEQNRSTAMKERTDLLATVKAETTAEINKTKAELDAQVKAAEVTLTKEATAIAATISTAILGRTVGGAR
ncbi:MAG: ATP synthase F0 subunit B [Blastocatellia bacterium]|nr:ATP synthase F0 subunit B [Blastocatellia bacterium]